MYLAIVGYNTYITMCQQKKQVLPKPSLENVKYSNLGILKSIFSVNGISLLVRERFRETKNETKQYELHVKTKSSNSYSVHTYRGASIKTEQRHVGRHIML